MNQTRSRFSEYIPEIFVFLSFYPCGAFLATLLHSFHNTTSVSGSNGDEADTFGLLWVLFLGILGAFSAALILFISRALAKRIVWLHRYLLVIGTGCLLGCGTALIQNRYEFPLVLGCGALGYGLVYISAMAFIRVRNKSSECRLKNIALCHFFLAVGVATSTSYMYAIIVNHPSLYHYFGYFIVYNSAIVLVCFVINESLHWMGVNNYKTCLDDDLTKSDVEKMRKKQKWRLTITAIVSKVLNGFLLSSVFVIVTMAAQENFSGSSDARLSILHYFVLAGILLGIWLLSRRISVMYPVVLVGQIICLNVAGICWNNSSYESAASFFWLFYLFGGAGVCVPDAMLMKVSHTKIYDVNLCLGFALEQIPIFVSLYFVKFEAWSVLYQFSVLWMNVGIFIAVAMVVAGLVYLGYPKNGQKRKDSLEQSESFTANYAPRDSYDLYDPLPPAYENVGTLT